MVKVSRDDMSEMLGKVEWRVPDGFCPTCVGSGRFTASAWTPFGHRPLETRECEACGGSGRAVGGSGRAVGGSSEGTAESESA